jgi:hypothetical protein
VVFIILKSQTPLSVKSLSVPTCNLFQIIDGTGLLITPQRTAEHSFGSTVAPQCVLKQKTGQPHLAAASDIGVMVLGAKPQN